MGEKMKIKSLFVLVLLLIIPIACSDDSSTEPENVATEQIESELRELDQMIFKMAGTGMNQMMEAMPGGIIDLSGVFNFQQNVIANAVQNDVVSLQKTAADTSIINIIGDLLNLFGTHTWDGTQWNYVDSPNDQVVIIFPYQNQLTNEEQTVTVKIFDLSISNSNVSISTEILVDDVKRFSVTVNVSGSGLLGLTGTPTLTSVSVSGMVVDNDGIEYNFSVDVTDDTVDVTIGETGEKELTILVEGSGFLSAAENGQEPTITKVTIEYGQTTLIIDDFESEQGDVGNVFYNGVKVADLVVKEDGELYIVYLNGTEKLFKQVMTSFGLIGQIN